MTEYNTDDAAREKALLVSASGPAANESKARAIWKKVSITLDRSLVAGDVIDVIKIYPCQMLVPGACVIVSDHALTLPVRVGTDLVTDGGDDDTTGIFAAAKSLSLAVDAPQYFVGKAAPAVEKECFLRLTVTGAVSITAPTRLTFYVAIGQF